MIKLERERESLRENKNYSFRYKSVGEIGISSSLYDQMKEFNQIKFPYKLDNVEFIEHLWINVDDIKKGASNSSREVPIPLTEISQFSNNLIKTGEYNPYTHNPPVVNEKGVLIAGNLRTESHLLAYATGYAEAKYMWVAVCRFTGERTNENDYTEFEFASEHGYNKLENNQVNTSIAGRGLPQEDVAACIERQIKFGTLKIDFEDKVKAKKIIKSEVNTYINLDTQQSLYVLERVLKSNGCDTSDVEIQYGKTQIYDDFQMEHGHKYGSSDYIWQAHISKNDTSLTNGRAAAQWLKLVNGEFKKIIALVRIKGSKNLKDLTKIRKETMRTFSVQWVYDFCAKFMAAVDNGNITSESFLVKVVHQYPEEEK